MTKHVADQSLKLLKDFDLKSFNTFKVSSIAKYFCVVKNSEDIIEAFNFIKKNNLKYLILGGGSNILFKNSFYDGLIIKSEISFLKESFDTVEVGAGYEWDKLVEYFVLNNIYGLENLSYIPGTVGAALVQNIGAYGVEVSSIINEVKCIDMETCGEKVFINSKCEFAYRDSIFKKENLKSLQTKPGQKYFIVSVVFKKDKEIMVKVGDKVDKVGVNNEESECNYVNIKKLNLGYKDIQNYIENNLYYKSKLDSKSLNLLDVRNIIIEIRRSKLPDWRAEGAPGSAGSFFKNPIILESEYQKLISKSESYKNIPAFEVNIDNQKYYKLSAGYILDKILNLKDFKIGNVGVFKSQALVIVSNDNATGEEIYNYSEAIIEKCKNILGLELEREVNVI